jgi:hypothetical protein
MILWQNIINKVVSGWLFGQKMKELMSSIGKEGLQKWEIMILKYLKRTRTLTKFYF